MIVNLLEEYLQNYIMIQEIWQHHRGFIEEQELRIVGVSNHCNQNFCFAYREKQRKNLDDSNCLKSVTHHAAGIGTCTQSGMTIPSSLSSEMHLGKFADHTEFKRWMENLRTEVCSVAKNPTRALQWTKEIEAAKSLDDFNTPKSINNRQGFP